MKNSKRAAMLWTGGKDSALALYEARTAEFEIVALVTFIFQNRRCYAHPTEILNLQASALEIPHHIFNLSEPYREAYIEKIKILRDEMDIRVLVTGDISEVDGHPNWIKECCDATGMEVFLPLWRREREELIRKLLDNEFKVMLSYVKKPWFTEAWAGKMLDRNTLAELKDLREKNGVDICGENGEFHTLVLNAPMFSHGLKIGKSSVLPHEGNWCVDIQEITP